MTHLGTIEHGGVRQPAAAASAAGSVGVSDGFSLFQPSPAASVAGDLFRWSHARMVEEWDAAREHVTKGRWKGRKQDRQAVVVALATKCLRMELGR